MRTNILKSLLFTVIMLSLAGCIQFDTVVKVNPDGSGRVEETILVKKEFAQLMKSMDKSAEQEQDAQTGFSIIDEAKLKKKGTEMGEGVTYVSAQAVVTEEFEGYKAVYSFADVNKLRINQNPKDKPSSDSDESAPRKKEEFVTFSFTKGDPSVLVVKSLKKKESSGDQEKPQKETTGQQGAEGFMKTMLKDLRFALSIDIQGTIVETNAMYREGSRVTLVEVDFGKLITASDKCERFAEAPPETMDEARKFLKDCPGIKMDLNDELRISFK